ncbi:MAG: 16S rRNA (guanine(966)-N(2))-methyltransferase RsmD [Pseudomonadota bacterium]
MRIISGELKGRPLASPRSNRIRPTTDGNRERLFNIIEHTHFLPTVWNETCVIDLFAGTGALGLEALSRGAAFGLFVDNSIEGRGLIRLNIESLGVAARARIFKRDATKLGERGKLRPAHLCFLDPPYEMGLAEQALQSLVAGNWLCPNALIIVEERASVRIKAPSVFTLLEKRQNGDTLIEFHRYKER